MLISRTPFRISFVGGGSDLPSYCERSTGAVLSATLDKAMYLTLHPYFDRSKTLLRYSRTELVDEIDQIEHPIFREALRLVGLRGGLEISSSADVPSGTGLGSSSSFTVGLLHVLSAYCSQYASREYLADTASHLEIDVLQEPIGRQDQYAAAFGGLNLIEFSANGQVQVHPLTIDKAIVDALEQRIMMFYTGGQRATRSILADQSEGVATDEDKFQATEKMVALVYEMRDALYAGDLVAFGQLLNRNWELKRGLSKHISNPDIDDAYDKAMAAGASGGKLLGAGGGGFLLIFAEPHKQGAVREALEHMAELPIGLSSWGSQIIYSDGAVKGSTRGFFKS